MLADLKKQVSIYAETKLPTLYGNFKVYVFHNKIDHKEHLAIVHGEIGSGEAVPVRIHSECLTSEVLGSLKCDCREQLQEALRYIAARKSGMVLYMRQEGRGIGLGNKIRAYALQEQGYDTVEANHKLGFADDLRRYDVAAGMLATLGVHSVQLITNNPQKVEGIEALGIPVIKRIPLQIEPNPVNEFYLYTKSKKSGHLLDIKPVDMAV
ncbi:MAG: GTP cyclohydrolase II [Calditrichaeota bacterium]|nr:GTP cyclohydrolase II [Calditrichota bacterium]MCB0307080.1 GTP cyclohydrolase II [Calditrichota bacterium]MCB9089048.1 GTP cyclohydrolase II [Calditrichia bacterium]